MKRRTFLERSALMSAALWPAFVQRAFALPCDVLDPACKPLPFGVADVEAAWKAALAAHRPLLVIVVPDDPTQQWKRGELWGELLNYGTDDQLAPLGKTELVCASMAALTTLVPLHKAHNDDVVAFVIEPKVNGTQTPVVAKVPAYPDPWARDETVVRDLDSEEERVGRKRIAILAAALHNAIPMTEPVDVKALAASVRASVVAKAKPPRGALWANGGGCGVDIEGGPGSMVDCGMGHAPKLSRRFLQFLVAP